MAAPRPTFHESWYRVAEIHPRLRAHVQISRQSFRGQLWYVLQDHTNNAFFRFSEPAYRLIAMLDGKVTVDQAWKLCNESLGDSALTQGETIQLLGQLYTSNLLQADVSPDANLLFARYNKRRQREVQSYLMSILFARIPIWDPDAFLDRWLLLFGWIFSWKGILVWLSLIGWALYEITSLPAFMDKLSSGPASVFNPDNMLLLYFCFAAIKACHEMGHAISCKKFGLEQGTGGEVHVIGIMLFFFSPVPYVDASSSWSLPSKWKRIAVAVAGMWVELAISSVAAIVWAHTNEGTLHQVCYNVMFIASVSTVLFNANPFLRYDGYYILSDLLEIPNLMQRSRDAVFYLVTKYIWGVQNKINPCYSFSEQLILPLYAIGAFVMRCMVSIGIVTYLASTLSGPLLILAAGLTLMAVIMWIMVPTVRFIRYLLTSQELGRTRNRALWTTGLAAAVTFVLVGLIPIPHHERAQGVVESEIMPEVAAATDGFIVAVPPELKADTDTLHVTKDKTWILKLENPELVARRNGLNSERQQAVVQRNLALATDPAKAKIYEEQIQGSDESLAILNEQIAQLTLASPADGLLVAPQIQSRVGSYLKRGEKIGYVIDPRHLIVRAVALNELAGQIDTEADRAVEIRVDGRPDILLNGRIFTHFPAGQDQLRWQQLSSAAGGQVATDAQDQHGQKAIEDFFEFIIQDIVPDNPAKHDASLLVGQRVTVRFTLKPKPIAAQAWTALLRVIQKRFQA